MPLIILDGGSQRFVAYALLAVEVAEKIVGDGYEFARRIRHRCQYELSAKPAFAYRLDTKGTEL